MHKPVAIVVRMDCIGNKRLVQCLRMFELFGTPRSSTAEPDPLSRRHDGVASASSLPQAL